MRRSSTTISTKGRANFKMVMVGERGVGKTSLLMRYDRGVFCKTYAVTIGVESFSKDVVVDSEKITLQIWDTAGQHGFKSIVKSFYSQACCVIIAYSDPQQLERTIQTFLKEIAEYGSEFVTVAVVRTKTDLRPLNEEERQSLEWYISSEKIKLWLGVSSKEGDNVEQFFEELAKQLLEKYEQHSQFKSLVCPPKNQSIMLTNADRQATTRIKCCT